ncbi:hypothetical protein QJS10_CPA06g01939 [Acorus calamus]|uniref:FRIGIDA-like protein n=1 Tax=Acorus calamus TaxID=4465 RepID=A0AAV9EKF7_ACOCL|nr:hypothetical protein QJS10_CPA06g01939 [Acorus calamus]
MTSAAILSDRVQSSFEDLERQRTLIDSCTTLWRELSDHFVSLDKTLQIRSDALKSKFETLNKHTEETLATLDRREESIATAVDAALSRVDAALASSDDSPADPMRSLCKRMDSEGFWELVLSKRRDADLLRSEIPKALRECVDASGFVLDAVSRAFPARGVGADAGWACVLVLESLETVLAEALVTPSVRERARGMAREWVEGLDGRGGIEGVKPQDAHAFLQHVVTFGVAEDERSELYRKLVMGSAWRRQMPRLAMSLGLANQMNDMIEELISKGLQLDAVNFAYEAGLVEKFPPVPLLKSYLEDSVKSANSILEDGKHTGKAMHSAGRKEQTALRAVIKCIEEHKLEEEFPTESLRKRLEKLEKAKPEKKKSPTISNNSNSTSSSPTTTNGPAIKRTRASTGGPLPPAKAGRSTNAAYVSSSFPAGPAFIRSPSSHPPSYPPTLSPYAMYGNRSPSWSPSYPYSPEMALSPVGGSYAAPPPPFSYPTYGGYNNEFATVGYQQAYYRC